MLLLLLLLLLQLAQQLLGGLYGRPARGVRLGRLFSRLFSLRLLLFSLRRWLGLYIVVNLVRWLVRLVLIALWHRLHTRVVAWCWIGCLLDRFWTGRPHRKHDGL